MKEIYYIEVNGARQYITYHHDTQVATAKSLNTSTVIPAERFHDFLATARALGLNAGII